MKHTFLFAMLLLPFNAKAETIDVRVFTKQNGQFTMDICRKSPESCEILPILPPSLRVGSMTSCVTSSLDNYRLNTGKSGTYLMYGYKNSCGKAVEAYVKVSNNWYRANTLQNGEQYVSVFYWPDEPVVNPGVIMFCGRYEKRLNDESCEALGESR